MPFRKKKEDVRTRLRRQRREKDAAAGVERTIAAPVVNTETVEERLARIRAGDAPVVAASAGTAETPAAPQDLGFVFKKATEPKGPGQLKITDLDRAEIVDVSAAFGRSASLVTIGERHFFVDGKKPAGVEFKSQEGEFVPARAITAASAGKIQAKLAGGGEEVTPAPEA